MLRTRFAAGLALLLAPAAVFAQGESTVAPPSGPAIVAPSDDGTIYGPAQKPGAYKPPVAKPPTVPKPASSTPAPVENYKLPTISIPVNPSLPSSTPGGYVAPSKPAPTIPLPGQGPVIVEPKPPAIPLPGQGPVIVKPAPSPAIPLPPQGPVIVTPAPPSTPATATPKPEPYQYKPPVTTTTKPEPTPIKPPVTATPKPEPTAPKPPVTAEPKPAPAPVGPSKAEQEEEKRRREARAAEAAHRAKQEAAAAAERAKQGLAYPDAQPIVPGSAVNIAPQTEPPSSGEIRGLGAKIQQLQKEAAIPPKPSPPPAKPPAADPCEGQSPEFCAAIERRLEREKREADRRLKEELRRERERAEREQRRLDREAERRERNAQREANRLERERLREQERDLGRDADGLNRERDRLDGRREARDLRNRELREEQQRLRQGGDPNCQSADCRRINQELTDLQKERVQDLRAETDLQRRGEKFDREFRRYRAESNDLEKRLDRGEGLSSEEHKDRMEAKERSRLADEMDRRARELSDKSSAASDKKGPPLTRAEQAELDRLRTGAGGYPLSNEQRNLAQDAALRIDFDRLSGRSTSELRETAREVGRAGQQLGDLEKRVGLGGPQPAAGAGGASARELDLQRQREKIDAATSDINNTISRQRQFVDQKLKVDWSTAQIELDKAREAGAPASEIARLERNLAFREGELRRGNAEIERLQRDGARAASGLESLMGQQDGAALANAGSVAGRAVNDYNRAYGNLIDEKGNVRGDEVRRQFADTDRAFQELNKGVPGEAMDQAVETLGRQGIEVLAMDKNAKVQSWTTRSPYADAFAGAIGETARRTELEAKPGLNAQESAELSRLRHDASLDRQSAREASAPLAMAPRGAQAFPAPAPAATDTSPAARFRREARPGQTFQQWYAEDQQRASVAGPASAPASAPASPQDRQLAAEQRMQAASTALDAEAAQRSRQLASADQAASDRAAARFLRYGRVVDAPAKPAPSGQTAASTPEQASAASARRDVQAAERKAAAAEGGFEAWRAARDRQTGTVREVAQAPKPAPERVASAPQRRDTQTPYVEYRNHIDEALERTQRAVEQAKDGTPVEKLRAQVNRTEAEINDAVRNNADTSALEKSLAGSRTQLVAELQKEMDAVGSASSAQRAASLESRQQEDERKRGDALAAAARRPEGSAAVVPGQTASTPRPGTTTTPEERAANAARREADEAAAAQKRKEDMAERERRTQEEARERALKFGKLDGPDSRTVTPASAPKPPPMKPEPPLQVAAVKPSPAAAPAAPPPAPAAEPQPTARPNDATPANSQPMGEGDPKARETYLAGLQQQVDKRVAGSEFGTAAIPGILAALADQLGPAVTDELLGATFKRLGSGTADAAAFLEALFTEVDTRAAASGDAEAARTSRMAHATALEALVNDHPPGAAAGLTDAQRKSLRASLHGLAQTLIAENAALATASKDPVVQALRQADVLNLSGMLDAQDQTARVAAEGAARSLAQILGGLKGNPSAVASAGDLATALEVAEGGIRTLPPGVNPAVLEGLVTGLADGYRALAEATRRSAGGEPAVRAQLIAEAESREARSRLATGRAVDALEALAPRAGEDAAIATARAGQRGALLERILAVYPGLSDEERARIGDPAKLSAERVAALRTTLAAERDPARIAQHAVPLIRTLESTGQAAEARKVASDAAARAPSDPMLQGEKLRLELLAQSSAAGLLDNIAPSAQPSAIAVALDGLAAAGRVDLIDRLSATAATSLRSNPTLANTLAVQADLAAIDALLQPGGDPKALESRIAGARNRIGLDSGLPLETIRTVSRALDQADAQARAVRVWQAALKNATPPPGGFTGVARDALQAGRLDIAADAVNRVVQGATGAPETRLRALTEAQALASLVAQRLTAPDLSASQRQAGTAFMNAVAGPLRKGLGEFADGQRKVLGALAARQSSAPQPGFGAEYDETLQRLRESARLGLELDLPGMTPEQRDARVNGRIGELNQQIHDKHTAIRKEFAGLREQVRTGETRERLDQRLAELDALKAERDGLEDFRLDTNRTAEYQGRSGPPQQVDSRTRALWQVERQLNGYNQGDGAAAWDDIKRTVGASAQGRLRGARGDRITQALRDANPDSWLETIMVTNESEYYERRRGQIIMEDPRRTLEQRRATLQQSYRFEADMYKRQGDSYLFNEITGTGEADLNRARERYGQAENQRLGWLRSDMEKAASARDPQGVFRSLVGLREAQLAGQIDAFATYQDVKDITTLGPVRNYEVRFRGRGVGSVLDAASVADAALHPALIRASYHPAGDLSAADRALLTEAGFLRNGQYVIPSRDERERLSTVTTAGTNYAKESVVDRYVNLRQAAVLTATVVLPGGFSSRIAGTFVSRVGMAELAAAVGARETAGVIATWAGSRVVSKVVEAGLFTATSRVAQTLVDPTLVLDESAWSLGALGKEYLHNLAVISALGLGGSAMGGARQYAARALGDRIAGAGAYATFAAATGLATVAGEAALLTGLDRLASGNAITQDALVGNLLTVGMLKTMHGAGPDLRGGGGEISQTARAQARYESWNMERSYERLANSHSAQMLRKQFNGSWEQARQAFKDKKITGEQMDDLLALRGTVINRLVAEIKAELGGDVQALGSVNRTSDYDLSFSGPKAELAVILFNARFGAAWRQAAGFGGGEAAARFDTNLYTRPVFDTIGRGEASDMWTQEGFAQMQARRNMDDSAWRQHVADTLAGAKDPAMNARLKDLLGRVEQRHQEYEKSVQERLPGAAAELGLRSGAPEADRVARNRLYEDALREIIGLREALDGATGARREEIMSQMRAAQSRALYFAAEAYLTQAAINHVVDSVQSTGRSINARTLLGPRPETGKVTIDENFARQSLIEQKGYISHYLHGPVDVGTSIKVGKYFIRVLDAMQLQGRNLRPLTALVETTSFIDARRGDAPQLKRGLAAQQMLAELGARTDLNATQRAELDQVRNRMRAEREAYDRVDMNADPAKDTDAIKAQRRAQKLEIAQREDMAIDDALAALQRMGGGDIDAAANRAAEGFVRDSAQALRQFTQELSGRQTLDPRAQLRFRRRRQPKTFGWLQRRGYARRIRFNG